MKHTLLLMLIYIFATTLACAQQSEASSDNLRNTLSHFQLGLQFNQVQSDFGMGLNLTTPHFFHQHVSLRVSGNVQWLQYIAPSTEETTWSPYGSYKVGVTGISGFITKSIFVYGEGGVVLMTPNRHFSDKSMICGSYGLFGFSFLINKGFSYFIELGGMGTGATAEKFVFKTIYSNGFTTSVGIRKSL